MSTLKILEINDLQRLITKYTKNGEIKKQNYLANQVGEFRNKFNFKTLEPIQYLILVNKLQKNFKDRVFRAINSEINLVLYSILIYVLADEFAKNIHIFNSCLDNQLIISYANGDKEIKDNILRVWFNYKPHKK